MHTGDAFEVCKSSFPAVIKKTETFQGRQCQSKNIVKNYKAFGFKPIGTYHAVGYELGAWHDVAWWQLSLQERREGKPAPPRPIVEVTGSRAYERAVRKGIATLGG